MIGRGLRARPVRARILNRYSGRKGRERRFGSYHADAVHFDTTDFLEINSLTCTSNEHYAFSFWAKVGATEGTALYVADKNGNGYPYLQITDPQREVSVQFGEDGFDSYAALSDNLIGAGWTHFLGSFTAPGTFKLYLNDTLATFSNETPGNDPFTIVGNGFPFQLNNGSDVDFAEVWIAPGVSLLSGGVIPEATRRKFISAAGKPVNLGADGSTPTATAPAIFFSGDASGFATNKGTGGAFTLTGTLTNASTSPSD